MSAPKYREVTGPDLCPSCIAWHCEYQRATLLLERLAEDRFTDQQAFDDWMAAQLSQVFRKEAP